MALLATRRPRAAGEPQPWLFHLLTGSGSGDISVETDRARFVGRGRTPANPAALQGNSPLSNTTGAVLDPVVSLRQAVTIAPQETVHFEVYLGVADSRETVLALVEKYRNPRMADRLFDLAWTHSQVTLRHLDTNEAAAQLYARMASALVYANPLRRAAAAIIRNNRRGQTNLWSYSISGDLPIVLLEISEADKLDLVRRLVQAHAYWRMKGLAVDLVIVTEDSSVYRQSLHERVVGLIASGIESPLLEKPGGILVRRREQLPAEDRLLLQSVARLVLSDTGGTLEEQLQRRAALEPAVPDLRPTRPRVLEVTPPLPTPELEFFNGLGGFTPDGKEYIITLQPEPAAPARKYSGRPLFSAWRAEKPGLLFGRGLADSLSAPAGNADAPERRENGVAGTRAAGHATPAPWVNVLANPGFGTVISETGGSYTWFENCHEFRLTPWHNDPVTDVSGETFYIRDDETGEFWSPTPLPARGATPYVIRHGFGYTVFEHAEQGIVSELWVYVALDAPVKFSLLKLRNLSGRARKLSVFGCWELVLGDHRGKSAQHVVTELDARTGALLARNAFNPEFADRVVFLDVNEPGRTLTGDRREFLGRNGSPANPAALRKIRLSGRTGAGMDPCAAMQVTLELPVQHSREICFRLGAAGSLTEAQEIIQRVRRPDYARKALEGVWAYWNRTLGTVNLESPDPAMNMLVNGWLIYQTLSSRCWGRTGFYQSGGAYGFRDQLQDALALVHAEPALLREQLLRAAARQFRQGDVQHWWHPPSGRGVRTHFSDDYLWLPHAVCRYVDCLNDTGVLDERVPFLEGRELRPEEESYYDLPHRADESATLYAHCVRAIEHGLRFGAHGLPLIGCGDWNDGFNLVGAEGRGESVWLGFFLFDVLTQFAGLARRRNDAAFADRCATQAAQLRRNLELHAWDGQWYRRAYFDDGQPLGSQENPECQIDSLSQSWAVLSGAGDPQRARLAMRAVARRLWRREAALVTLFDPPFDRSPQNPGYVKGYLPGVRENGGQYTHAAIWAVMAFAELGELQRAWRIFGALNPINHARTPAEVAVYKVEPYVVAADVYSVAPHVGRGGWSWYTGSAGWMYRLATESLLGLKLEGGDKLRLNPRLPQEWVTCRVHYRHRQTVYHLTFEQDAQPQPKTIRIIADGQELADNVLTLVDDQQEHHVSVHLHAAGATTQMAETAGVNGAD